MVLDCSAKNASHPSLSMIEQIRLFHCNEQYQSINIRMLLFFKFKFTEFFQQIFSFFLGRTTLNMYMTERNFYSTHVSLQNAIYLSLLSWKLWEELHFQWQKWNFSGHKWVMRACLLEIVLINSNCWTEAWS